MNHWRKSRNYRRVRDANGVVIACVISVDGEDVEVTEEIYEEYARIEHRERYLAEKDAEYGLVSLDELAERGVFAEAAHGGFVSGLDEDESERDARQRALACLNAALPALNAEESRLIHTLYYDDVSVRKYAQRLGVRLWTVQCRREKILKKLRTEILKKFKNFS